MIDFTKFQNTFIDNAMDWLIEIENGLCRLEQYPQDKELLNNIFRMAHNIKSTSGTVGFNDIYTFAHKVEDVLHLVSQDSLTLDKEIINALLEAIDLIWEMVEACAAKTGFDFQRCKHWTEKMEKIKPRMKVF